MDKHLDSITMCGTISAPPSKSDAQRAIFIAALCDKESIVISPGESKDVQAIIYNIQQLGATVERWENELKITGTTEFPSNIDFDANEAGLSFRVLSAVSAFIPGKQQVHAKGTLLNRSQQFIINSLNKMGCTVDSNNGFPPISIIGEFTDKVITIDASESSQFLSGLLMSAPLRNSDIVINVNNLNSAPYVHMTLASMEQFGVTVQNNDDRCFLLKKESQYSPCKYKVEGDWSSASYWFVAAALGADIKITGLNSNSYQADRNIIDVLRIAHCNVVINDKQFTVDGSERQAFTFDATDCPDLFPALVVLAAGCNGNSTIQGVNRLRNKESDRASVLISEFLKLGLDISINGNTMKINGTGVLSGGTIDPHNDHRIAMCGAIASMISNESITILNADCVEKSYPGFWIDWEILTNVMN